MIGQGTGCGLKDQEVNLGKVQCHFSVVPTDMRTRERKVLVVGERAKIPAADGNSVVYCVRNVVAHGDAWVGK